MAIDCVCTPYGPAAHETLAGTVHRLKAGDPLAPVSVIVPGNYAGVAARRALGRRGAMAAVTFLTTYRLAELLGASLVAAGGRRPVSSPVLAAAVRAVLAHDPGHFTGVASHPATERSLVRAHRELSELDDHALARLAATSPKAADVVRIHRGVRELLRGRFSDEHDLVRAAIDALSGPVPVLAGLGPVVVFLPQRLTAGQTRLIRAVAERATVVVIAGVTGEPTADAAVTAAVDRLGTSLPDHSVRPASALAALSVSDADDEVRHALRKVITAVRSGAHLGSCAILYGTAQPYARLVADALDSAGIGWHGASVRTADTSLLGRSLLRMLALGDHDLSRRDVGAWLAAAPVRGIGNRPVPAAAWERAARAAGVLAGREQWISRLGRLADDLEAEADELSRDEAQAWRADRDRREASRARDLATFVDRLAADLDPGTNASRWSTLAGWCRGLVRRFLGGEDLRSSWPEHERRAAGRVDAAIDRLGDLDGIDPDPSAGAFRRALELELESDLGRHGSFGNGVLVGPVGLAVGVELQTVIVLGMAEGTFPARRREDVLLPDRERAVAGPDLPPRADRTADDHRGLLAALATAPDSLLTFPRGDLRRSSERTPSRWLLDTAEARDGIRPSTEQLAEGTGDWLREVPSFVAGLRAAGFPAHAQEYDLRRLLDDFDRRRAPGSDSGVLDRPELRRGMELIRARLSTRFTRFDGNLRTDGDLRGVHLPSPTDTGVVVSATRLEAWASCPHAYFVRYVLGVDAVEAPDEQHRISPLTRGSLVHRALERWLAEALTAGELPAPTSRWPTRWRERLVEIGAEECDRLEARGMVGRPIYWRGDRRSLLDDLERFVDFDDAQRSLLDSRPVATEMSFGLPGDTDEPVELALPDGRELRIRGSIDRVDESSDGTITVIDYKTGSNRGYRQLSADDPAPGGGHLQLVLYAAAARRILGRPRDPVRGAYWFVSEKGGFDTRGYTITPEVEAGVLQVVGEIVDGIAQGRFPLHPEPPGWRAWVSCDFCEPDGLGTRPQWRDWERKKDDPELMAYRAIVEPDLLHQPGGGDG